MLALSPEECAAARVTDARLVELWAILRRSAFFLGICDDVAPDRLAELAQGLGARLRVHKLVVVDPLGGVRSDHGSGALSFMDEAVAEHLLQTGEAEWAGLGARRPMLDAIRHGLLAGIDSVNLCTLDGLARELFTYEGSGTLFTREDYVKVDRLSLDDFHEVEKLLERGEREGYLKPRSPDEMARILVSGYGATIGSHRLAGVCSLQTEPYAAAGAGEIVGLYTITRFKTEGVGAKLVDCMKSEGRRSGLRYLFACTTQERAGQFFERQGFRRIPRRRGAAGKVGVLRRGPPPRDRRLPFRSRVIARFVHAAAIEGPDDGKPLGRRRSSRHSQAVSCDRAWSHELTGLLGTTPPPGAVPRRGPATGRRRC